MFNVCLRSAAVHVVSTYLFANVMMTISTQEKTVNLGVRVRSVITFRLAVNDCSLY